MSFVKIWNTRKTPVIFNKTKNGPLVIQAGKVADVPEDVALRLLRIDGVEIAEGAPIAQVEEKKASKKKAKP